MTEANPQENSLDLDEAIAGRLARLRSLPVDTSRLDQLLRGQIPERPHHRWTSWPRPFQAIAASVVLLVGLVGAFLLTASSGPVLASGIQMAQVHADIVAGRIPVMQVDSIAKANQMLADKSPGAPSLPQIPQSHVMACCMKSVHDKKMACVLLKDGGIPVTLSVANAADMKLPAVPTMTRNGTSYRVQSVNGLSMVMTERSGKWLCLIGAMPAERLMDMAELVQF